MSQYMWSVVDVATLYFKTLINVSHSAPFTSPRSP